ncbi:hypothetical protein [Methanobrevibacter sp.]|jgi:hypothetical protein|uniref:hypothetical protein n=1 Tax=Methanobrevibacter sp. TaxID=66852 RepID=UPI00386CCF56
MDTRYLIHVSDYQPELLPRPVPKVFEKSETLDELPIILYGCELWSIVKLNSK